jgi:replicative DNA helicase
MNALVPISAPELRLPPHNFEAEMALLGALMANNRAWDDVAHFLKPEHFADDRHGRIYEACGKLIERGHTANAITLKNHFEQDASLTDVGGAQYLARLTAAVISIMNAPQYGQAILDLYLRRQLILKCEEWRAAALDDEDMALTGVGRIEMVEADCSALAEGAESSGGPEAVGEALGRQVKSIETAWKADGHVAGIATGLRELDLKIGGLYPSDLIIVAGRPGAGKTALATTIMKNVAGAYREERQADGSVQIVAGAKVGFFSLEMSKDQISARILADETGIGTDRQRRGGVDALDMGNLVEAQNRLRHLSIFIDDTASASVAMIRSRARRLKRRRGIGLVVIDYLQLMGGAGKAENRVLELSAITRGLKALAKDLAIPVVALSQLSRAVELREDKRPQLSDLRESGSIEQDADSVIFVYREEYYLQKLKPRQRENENQPAFQIRLDEWGAAMERVKGLAELIIGKNRHGAVATVECHFDGARTRFSNLGRLEV